MSKELKQAITKNRKTILELTDPELKKLLPVLKNVRDQVHEKLTKMMKDLKPDDSYTMQMHRSMLVQLRSTIKMAEKTLPQAMRTELMVGTRETGKLSIGAMSRMIQASEKKFTGAITTLRLPVAKILMREQALVAHRHEKAALKYGGEVGKRLQNDLAIGVVRGESIAQMANRVSGGGRYAEFKEASGEDMADAMADRQMFRNQYEAQRFVRTEMNGVYNQTQIQSLREAEKDDPGWKKRWDAKNDACDECDELDGEIVDYDDVFSNGLDGPPAHPNCCCGITPWRDEWKGSAVDVDVDEEDEAA